jgi:heme exporter protein A
LQAFNLSTLSSSEVHVWRGDRHVLRGVSIQAGAGQFVHVAGPNGAGKSTLLRVLAGLLTPEQGSVDWRGRPINSDRESYSATLSYLGHSDGLKSDFTARENLAFEVGLRRRIGATAIDEALERVELSESRDQPARFLSAGQRRRLAIARVLLAAVPLWILDEPFTNLDSMGTQRLSDIIAEHLDAGGAAIIAAHQPPVIPRYAAHRVDLA